jgi:hypothetical protein
MVDLWISFRDSCDILLKKQRDMLHGLIIRKKTEYEEKMHGIQHLQQDQLDQAQSRGIAIGLDMYMKATNRTHLSAHLDYSQQGHAAGLAEGRREAEVAFTQWKATANQEIEAARQEGYNMGRWERNMTEGTEEDPLALGQWEASDEVYAGTEHDDDNWLNAA